MAKDVAVKKPGKDWVTPVALVGGGAALIVGAVMLLKKPPGIEPGGRFKAVFELDYGGEGGDYIFQVWLGWRSQIFPDWFDHEEGLVWTAEVNIPQPTENFTYELICEIPMGAKASNYDAEATVRRPGMGQFDYLIKHIGEHVIVITKE